MTTTPAGAGPRPVDHAAEADRLRNVATSAYDSLKRSRTTTPGIGNAIAATNAITNLAIAHELANIGTQLAALRPLLERATEHRPPYVCPAGVYHGGYADHTPHVGTAFDVVA